MNYKLQKLMRRMCRTVLRVIAKAAPDGTEPLPDLKVARRILLVLVNYRMGNTVLATPAVSALIDALPMAKFSFVGGPYAPGILKGYNLKHVYTVSRRDFWLPLRMRRFIRTLRQEHYDVAIHLSMASASLGAFIMYASGAKHRIGCRGSVDNIFFTSAMEHPPSHRKVDQINDYMRWLGIYTSGERKLVLSNEERCWAERFFKGKIHNSGGQPIGIFVGSRQRKGKSWDISNFGVVAKGLRSHGFPVVVFIGHEEASQEERIRASLGEALYIKEPDIRRVAALVSGCRAVFTPDSGPMHLSIAVGTKTVALFVKPNFERYGPRQPQGEVVFDPYGTSAEHALQTILKLCTQSCATP
ncbi:MAG TPA: glycosyltransferase family 9 protein [Candidatus Wujingus californicus]|uniref:glycosyltransferase family 9 protein n=2 Tax=Candidatus Wujingus californicus TaxID=3367618 RepID=UPI001D4E4E6F|nr:glycosyltransferase family 9 protein [Planctomycetota bacterium]MDO8132318.1 glycosyltransferase family 9 protein [Candidatus Brocadiales bacterium]